MCNKKKKQIGVFILLFLFLIGMYFDLFKADSSFLYVSGGAVDFNISSAAPVLAGAHAFSAKQTRTRVDRGSEYFTSRLARYRWDAGRTPDYLAQNNICLSEIRFYLGFQSMQALFGNHDHLVTKYIHNSDGKKRIS